jgi:photosystem II stability/assembly factor-like uncharacterized protein/putative cell wall-binding protein
VHRALTRGWESMGASRSILSRRILSVLLSLTMFAAGAPFSAASAAGPPARRAAATPYEFGPTPTRISAPYPYGNALAISRLGWTSSAYVVLASTRKLPDQLLAATLAGVYRAPLLLTEPGYLPSPVAREVARLHASRVFVVGGGRSVSYRVIRGLVRGGIRRANVKRVGADSVYSTARLVASQIKARRGRVESVVLVNASKPNDALGIAGLAGRYGMPVLYTTRAAIPLETSRALKALKPQKAILIGGTGSISAAEARAFLALTKIKSARVLRIAMPNIYASAAAVAELAFANGFAYETVIVGNSSVFRDPLAAGAWAAKIGGHVVLTQSSVLPTDTNKFFESHCSAIKKIYLLGTTGAISAPVSDRIKAAAQTRLRDDVQIVPAAAAASLTDISPSGSMTFVDGPSVPSLETSQVIVSGPTAAAPDGFLRRVTGVTKSYYGSMPILTVETTQATLEDVIEKGSIDVTGEAPPPVPSYDNGFGAQQAKAVDATHVDVSFASLSAQSLSARSNAPAAALTAPATRAPAAPSPRDSFARAPGAFAPAPSAARSGQGGSRAAPATTHGTAVKADATIGSFSKSFSNTLYERNGLKVRTETSINLDASYVFNISFGLIGWTDSWIPFPIYGLQNLQFITYVGEGASVKLIAQLDADFAKEIELGRFRIATVNFLVGVVPVNIVFYVVPLAGADATFHGEASAGVNQTMSIALGFSYDYRWGWSPVTSFSFGIGLIPPEANASLDAKAWLGARLEAMFYDSFGPSVQPQAYLKFGADTTKNPWWWLNGGAEAKVGGKVDIFGKNKTFSWGPYNIFDRRIAQASGAFPSLAPGRTLASDKSQIAMAWASARTVETAQAPATVSPAAAPASVSRCAATVSGTSVAPQLILDGATIDTMDFLVEGLSVSDAVLLPDAKTVRLTTTSQDRNRTYDVAVAAGSIKNTGGVGVMASSVGFLACRPPRVMSASAVDAGTVDVSFDAHQALDPSTVQPDDFTAPGLTVGSAAVRPDGKTVRLGVTGQSKGVTYTVSVADGAVSDGLFASDASSADFPGFWPPGITSAWPADSYKIDVTFDSRLGIDPSTVQPGDFAVPGLTVSSATVQADGKTVRLGTDEQTPNTTYTVSAGEGAVSDGVFASAASSADFPAYWQPWLSSATAVDSRTVDVDVYSYSVIVPASVRATDFAVSGVSVAGPGPAVTSAVLQPDGRTIRIGLASYLYPQGVYSVEMITGAITDGFFPGLDRSGTLVTALAPAFTMTSVAVPIARPGTVVRFADPTHGYITHTWGGVSYTSDGGTTWVNRQVGAASNMHVRDISFLGGDPNKPVVVGWGGLIRTSTNAGVSWTARTNTYGPWPLPLRLDTDHLWTVDFADASKGYIGGSGLNKFQVTGDGGATWAYHSQSATIPVDGRWIRFAPDGLHGWYAVGDKILATSDGGVTWGLQYSGAPGYFACIHAQDAQRAWAVGSGGMIVRTTDGGATWQVQSSGTTQDLSGVAFTDADNGFAVGANSTVLYTWDGGAKWVPVTPPVTAPLFDSTTYSDSGTAWIVGYLNGTTPRVLKVTRQW